MAAPQGFFSFPNSLLFFCGGLACLLLGFWEAAFDRWDNFPKMVAAGIFMLVLAAIAWLRLLYYSYKNKDKST